MPVDYAMARDDERDQTAYGFDDEPSKEARLPVPREIEGLRELAERMHKQVENLRERLDPLMGPSAPVPEKAASLAMARDEGSAHAATLADVRGAFDVSYRRLQDIVSRLEI